MTVSRIVFDHVWKKFHRGQIHDSLRDLIPAVANRLLGRGENERELSEGDFWAVRDLSFEVMPGQCLGIIGPNGSGKSTSLKLLTRILEPTRGHCEIFGRVGALIEVSAGFHGDLTGRENVFLQGAIMGMSRADIVRKFDEIVEFSGVIDAIDTPVKRYSSGMNARLGFSIAAHLEPEVLIIDEVLSVGDLSFQERAFGRIRDLTRSGIPVVMVSHQLERVAELCSSVILLIEGGVAAHGTPREAISAYVRQADVWRAAVNSGLIVFDSVSLSEESVVSGERFAVLVRGRIPNPIGEQIEPVRVRLRSLVTGTILYATGSQGLRFDIARVGEFSVRIDLQANVAPGKYLVEVIAVDPAAKKDVATYPAIMLDVQSPGDFVGTVQLNASMSLLEPIA